MHDFFADRLVHTKSFAGTIGMLSQKTAAGGGGLNGIRQEEVRGGNAVNLAHARTDRTSPQLNYFSSILENVQETVLSISLSLAFSL
jgi:hypothetical protein